jgi:hypothetical protein
MPGISFKDIEVSYDNICVNNKEDDDISLSDEDDDSSIDDISLSDDDDDSSIDDISLSDDDNDSSIDDISNEIIKKREMEERYCDCCHRSYKKNNWSSHIKTIKHSNNLFVTYKDQ